MLEMITAFILGQQSTLLIILLTLFWITILAFLTYYFAYLIKLKRFGHSNFLPPLDVNGLNKELEPYGFAYNPVQDIFYSIMYPWQRKYGFCRAYDRACPLLSMIIDAEPIYFNYNNRSWLIEFWKGQYGMTTGGEIGIYVSNDTTNLYKDIIYESVTDSECIPMSYILKKKKKKFFTRNANHWWLTGFKLGEYSKPKDLIMELSVTLKNISMCNAFVNGLKRAGYQEKEIRISSTTVYLTFNKPHTMQPLTRNIITTFLGQLNNRLNCRLYNKVTKGYTDSLAKINYLRSQFPIIYKQVMNFENDRKLYQKYRPTPK